MLKQDLPKLKIIGDVFEAHHYVSVNDVREMFSDNEIGGSFFRKEMYRIKTDFFLSSLFNSQKMKKWQHSVDLSNPLKDFDYKEIAAFMNLHNGKYLEVWKGEKNEIRNIEKLALFTRSLQRIEKLNYFKNLPEDVWASCINGIVNTPQEVVPALMQYKYTSLKINNAITDKTKNNSQIEKFIKSIEKFLNSQTTTTDLKAFRGEGNFCLFKNVKLENGKTLKDILEDVTQKIENKEWEQNDIDRFIQDFLHKRKIEQERFMSTALIKDDTEKYAQKVFWHLDIPKGTKASFIESYNVERESESEILVQKGSKLFIRNANYDHDNHRWNIWATVNQDD